MNAGTRPELPWRGPEGQRPELPLPPGRMPLRRRGRFRKRWTYVAVFCEELMLCAGSAQVGPIGQSFWAVWDRERRRLHERTRLRAPGRTGDVRMELPRARFGSGPVSAELRFGAFEPVEAICPSGDDGYGWTRKAAGVPVEGKVTIGDREIDVAARGVIDESAGYHQRHTSWMWSAGVGTSADGRSIGWNLVTGINDPPNASERSVWVDGVPFEPGPVNFEKLDAVAFADGSRMEFSGEAERVRSDNALIFRSRYRQPFGTFTGSCAGIELERGLGVMEQHSAVW